MPLETDPTYVDFVTEWPMDRIYRSSTPADDRVPIPFFDRACLQSLPEMHNRELSREFLDAVNFREGRWRLEPDGARRRLGL